MLVLQRRAGEQLLIGRDIQITVLKVRGKQVKLGISGPAEIPIHRAELRSKLMSCPVVASEDAFKANLHSSKRQASSG